MNSLSDLYRSKVWEAINFIGSSGIFIHSKTIKVIDDKGNEILLPEIPTLLAINALVPRGTALLYGGYGAGKTTLARVLGRMLAGLSSDLLDDTIIRAHPHLTEEKLVGRLHIGKLLQSGEEEVIWRGFTTSFWKIIDEVNRLNPQTQDVVLSLLSDGIVKYFDEVYRAKDFVLYATINPSDVGAYDLGLPFLDRFGIAIPFTNPTITELYEITQLKDDKLYELNDDNVPVFLNINDLHTIWGIIENMPISRDARMFIGSIARELSLCARVNKETGIFLIKGNDICENCPYYNEESICHYSFTPLSVRAAKDLLRYSKALTWLLGFEKVNVGVVASVAPYIIWHRMVFSKNLLSRHNDNAFYAAKDLVQMALNRFINRLPIYNLLLDTYFNPKPEPLNLREIRRRAEKDIVVNLDLLPEIEEIATSSKLQSILNELNRLLADFKFNELFAKLENAKMTLPPHIVYRISRIIHDKITEESTKLIITYRKWKEILNDVLKALNAENKPEARLLLQPRRNLTLRDSKYYISVSTTTTEGEAPVYIHMYADKSVADKIIKLIQGENIGQASGA
ncbi:MAG: AAA family ATPase [Candidatus Njordarchaeia archaeon]